MLPLFPEDDETPEREPAPEEPQTRGPLSIAEVTAYIRDKFDLDATLQDLWVEGEISNLTRAPSGHMYFTLKDNVAALRAVMWRSSVGRLRFEPQQGDHVLVHGKISVYEPRGEYQLYADDLQPVGVGDLHLQFERLKSRLAAEGLFDPERKRRLPVFPQRIGVVTSAKAAAFQDVLNVLRRRFPLAEVILSPTLVQGESAPPQIVKALEALYQRDDIDVILMVRGGGSLEDLWAFNDERVVRAVVAAPLPVVTGVGHEIDFTLADFASDHRAPTPSAAAEETTPDIVELARGLRLNQQRSLGAISALLEAYGDDLSGIRQVMRHLSPQKPIENYRQRVDGLAMRLQREMLGLLSTARDRLTARQSALEAASPAAILARGYAIVTRTDDGERLLDADDVAPGTLVHIQLYRGELRAKVQDREAGDTADNG
ncbi:MAG: exodeoxyribonuclease VII large subunit [Chloroflexi bacterium]|nr:exodeoxyribonuclease VII large subunit [Chloroflexota bacterium]